MKGYISKEGRRSECVRKEGEFYGYVHINLEININLYISIAYLCVFLIFYKEAAYDHSLQILVHDKVGSLCSVYGITDALACNDTRSIYR